MIDDKHHEAHGAMIHRGLVEQRTVNHHGKQKEALDFAVRALKRVKDYARPDSKEYITASAALVTIEEILK